ncbi:hypothetical protein MDAP_001137 [Mitosporidium daphniae]
MPFLSSLLYDEITLKRRNDVDYTCFYRVHASIKELQIRKRLLLVQLYGARNGSLLLIDISKICIDPGVNVCDGDILALCKFEGVFISHTNGDVLPLFEAVLIRPIVLASSDDLRLFHDAVSIF